MSRSPADRYAFEITLHGHPSGTLAAGTPYADLGGTWPTVVVPRESLSVPMAIDFDAALARLGTLERMFVEPDGALVWTSRHGGDPWQVDGNACERDGRLLLVDLKGSCPAAEFDRLLGCLEWPRQQVLAQLVRPGVFLAEAAFRRHAVARWLAGDGETLRPR